MNLCICQLLMGKDNNAKKTLHGANAVDVRTVNWSCLSRNSNCKAALLTLSLQSKPCLFQLCFLMRA